MAELSDRVALVTGASRGIGAATAEALASRGAHVILVGRTSGGLEEVEERIHQAGGTATIAPLDITDSDSLRRLAEAVAGRWGKLDHLILNAGTLGTLTPVPHIEAKEWAQIIAVNVTANQQLLSLFDPLLRKSDAGCVLALTSSVASTPRAYWGGYAASKAALEALIGCYGEEVAAITPIRTAIVDPARTATRMRAKAYPGEDPATLKPASDVGEAIAAFIAGDFEQGARLDLH